MSVADGCTVKQEQRKYKGQKLIQFPSFMVARRPSFSTQGRLFHVISLLEILQDEY